MPLMMDDEVDMDDLFGEGGDLGPGFSQSLPLRPPGKELYQRLDELRGSGCTRGIAWSKWGSIASIASNGAALELRNLRCHPDDGTWALSDPTVTPNFTSALDGGPLKHLSWSPTGSDLAVIDTAGRVTILAVFSSLNKPSLSRACQQDPTDDLHAVVGSFWLNLAPYPPNRPTILHGPAVKEESGDFRYEASQAPVLGPCHPAHSKSAFVCLTNNGLLRVIWPQNNGKWMESHTELESVVSSDDLITHAAICPDKTGTLLIAFATASKQLRTVRALIEWGQPKIDKVPPAQLPLNPTIKTRHLAVTSWQHDISGDSSNASHFDSSMVQLSHLGFLPPCGDLSGKMIPPTIIAVRSYTPPSASHYNQEVCTIVDRWEIREKSQVIHKAFEALSSRRNSVGSQPGNIVFLKRLESFTVPKIVVTIDSMNHGKVIFFAYSDSSVEYRDRVDMAKETFKGDDTNKPDLDRVWHLSQTGFSYTEDEPCLQVALSPSYCSVVQIRHDGKTVWKQLDFQGDLTGKTMKDAHYAAVIASLSLSCATAVMRNVNYDDLLATANRHATPNFAYDWLFELSRILKVHMDYSEETHHDVLVRNTTIQLCLCIQSSLGFNGQFNPRTFSGKFGWLVLQLRNIVVLVTMAANLNISGGPNSSDKTSPLEDPEVINSLAGSVRWVLDLMAWLIDTLISLYTDIPKTIDLTQASKLSLSDLLAHLHSTNTISLHLLLSSPTRGFLTAICRRLQHLDYIARKAIMLTGGTNANSSSTTNSQNPGQNNAPPTLSPSLRAAYMQIATLTSNTIVRIKTMETLLASLTSMIKNAYLNTSPSLSGSPAAERNRNVLEIKMLFGGSFPDAFKGVIVELFRKDGGLLSAVQEEIEPARLFFADFTMLEVDEDELSVKKRKDLEKTMDSFRKQWLANPAKKSSASNDESSSIAQDSILPIGAGGLMGVNGKQGARWRRCARCASVMEDVLTPRQALQWLVMQQRRCFCSGYWDTLAPGKIVA